MSPDLAALVVHDLKNELGALEAALERSIDHPSVELAQQNHLQCADLRQRFVQFLTLYGQAGALRILATDESPMELLGNAALGIAALVAIWAVMQTLGLDVVDWMRGQLRV